MTKQVQRRRGTSSQHTSFTGAEGEISVNTSNKSIHVHDGTTAGGIEAARADLGNVSDANLNSALAGNTLSSLTITSADINGGTIDGTVIGGTDPAAISGTTLTATGDVTITDRIIHAGDTNTQIRFPAADTVTVETNGAERLRVNSGGNVGIGTSSPTEALDVKGAIITTGGTTNQRGVILGHQNNINASFVGRSENGIVDTGNRIKFNYADNSLSFDVNAVERMRITSAGNVGIGTSANAASIVDAQSTTKGVRFPNMTTAQKTAIANVAGNVVFDTTLGKLCVNSGSGWETITSI